MNRFLRIIFLVLITTLFSKGQSFYSIRRERTLILSVGAGSASYFGELKDKGKTLGPDPSINLNVGLQYFFTSRIAARVELDWIQLRGDDSKSVNRNRNLSFSSNNFELSASGLVNLFPNGMRFYQRATFNIYGFAGIGFLYMNPMADYQGTKYALQPLMTEGVKYSKLQPVIPYGLGVKVKTGPFFNIAVEGGWRKTFTDYLDDVSTVYPDRSTWDPNSIRYKLTDRSDELLGAEPFTAGHKRGNPDKNDSYFLLNVKVEYYLSRNFLFKGSGSRNAYRQKRRSISHRRR